MGTLLPNPSFYWRLWHTKRGVTMTFVVLFFPHHLCILRPPNTAKQGQMQKDKSTLLYPPPPPTILIISVRTVGSVAPSVTMRHGHGRPTSSCEDAFGLMAPLVDGFVQGPSLDLFSEWQI